MSFTLSPKDNRKNNSTQNANRVPSLVVNKPFDPMKTTLQLYSSCKINEEN